MQGYYDGEYKQGELLDLSVFPDEVKNEVDDNWGEPVSMEHDYRGRGSNEPDKYGLRGTE